MLGASAAWIRGPWESQRCWERQRRGFEDRGRVSGVGGVSGVDSRTAGESALLGASAMWIRGPRESERCRGAASAVLGESRQRCGFEDRGCWTMGQAFVNHAGCVVCRTWGQRRKVRRADVGGEKSVRTRGEQRFCWGVSKNTFLSASVSRRSRHGRICETFIGVRRSSLWRACSVDVFS